MRRRVLFLIGLLFELLCVFGLFASSEMIRAGGTQITLQTTPVDPYSLFRGQYVQLDYDVGRDVPRNPLDYGQRGYIVLMQSGSTLRRLRFTAEQPFLAPRQYCLRGTLQGDRVRFPDVAQYFIEQGGGQGFEEQARTHHLLVDMHVSKNCRAVIDAVRVGRQITPAEREQMNQRLGIPAPVEAPPREKPKESLQSSSSSSLVRSSSASVQDAGTGY